jgi:hypothetical protein
VSSIDLCGEDVVYAKQGWWCFGCARGGRTFDLASHYG